MSISPTRKPVNGNPGIVPPWLQQRDPNEPHTWAELEAKLNDHGWHELRSDEVPMPTTKQETIE